MRKQIRSWTAPWPAAVATAIALVAVPASGDNADDIRELCATRWADNKDAQTRCRTYQSDAARELLLMIEAVPVSSREFKVARKCIEGARVRPRSPSINWANALECFESQRPVRNAAAEP